MASYHVHAVHWNEPRLLPAFFRHYASAAKIYIYDNESDAETQKMLAGYGAEVIPFSTGGTFDDAANQRIKNSAWKRSKGKADFVIVQDLDELVHFPWLPGDIQASLELYKGLGITCAQSQCYCVICSDEEWDGVLSSDVPPWKMLRKGFRGDLFTRANYDKVQVFAPDVFSETNFTPGAHQWSPVGSVCPAPAALQPLMLHCKHIGSRYEVDRRRSLGRRLSPLAQQWGWAWQYRISDQEMEQKVKAVYSSDQIADISAHLDRSQELWVSQDWTSGLQETVNRLYAEPQLGPMKVLEIGCFEGRGTRMMLERLCSHRDSVVYCVDPWLDAYVPSRPEFSQLDKLFAGQYQRFAFNTRFARGKVKALRGTSDAVLPTLNELFDLVYVDGDHHPDQVYLDGVMALRLAKPGGVIVFDDYGWNHNGVSPRTGVDRFVAEFAACVTVIHRGAQLAVRVSQVWGHQSTARARLVDGLPTVLIETWGRQDAISRAVLDGDTWEPNVALAVAAYFKARPRAAMLDIGANIGVHALAAAKAGAAHVFAFECHPVTAGKLRKTVQMNRCEQLITVTQSAVSDEAGKMVRLGHIPSNVGASCIDSADNRFSSQRTDVHECGTVALDSFQFTPALETFPSIFVKLDVEGHELQAVRGMRRVLSGRNVDLVLVELNPFTSSRQSLSTLIDELIALGFRDMEALFVVPPDPWHGRPGQISGAPTVKPVSKDWLLEAIGRDAVLEVAMRRPT